MSWNKGARDLGMLVGTKQKAGASYLVPSNSKHSALTKKALSRKALCSLEIWDTNYSGRTVFSVLLISELVSQNEGVHVWEEDLPVPPVEV